MIEDFENFIQVDDNFILVLDSRNCTTNNLNLLYENDGVTEKSSSPYYWNSDLTFKLQTPIIQPTNVINMKASVINFTCPNSQYVINDTNNSLGISFDTSGTIYVNSSYNSVYNAFYITLTNGNYTAKSFITEMVNKFNILSNSYGGTVDNPGTLGIFSIDNENTNKYTINNDRFYFFISQNLIFKKFFNPAFNSKVFYTIGDVMGFDNTKTYKSKPNDYITGAYSLELPFPVNFGGLQNINVHFENLKTQNIAYQSKNLVLALNNSQEFSNFSKGNLGCSIPVNCNPMDVIFYQKIGTFYFTIRDDIIDQIRIVLRDDLGNLLQLNGQNWNITIEFLVTKHIERKTRNFYSILANPYPTFQ
jgi:hypothetical protein